MLRCPGQDPQFWKPQDIFDVQCPYCGEATEFFKDEPKLKCRKCGAVLVNPKIDLGCAEWCNYAKQCAAVLQGGGRVSSDKLKQTIKKIKNREDNDRVR